MRSCCHGGTCHNGTAKGGACVPAGGDVARACRITGCIAHRVAQAAAAKGWWRSWQRVVSGGRAGAPGHIAVGDVDEGWRGATGLGGKEVSGQWGVRGMNTG